MMPQLKFPEGKYAYIRRTISSFLLAGEAGHISIAFVIRVDISCRLSSNPLDDSEYACLYEGNIVSSEEGWEMRSREM
jgi:hypothetical protein